MPIPNKKKTKIIIIAVVVLALLAGTFSFCAIGASTEKSYNGVYVGSVHVGGMEKEKIEQIIAEKYPHRDSNITIECEGESFSFLTSQILLRPNYESSAQEAVNEGKDGNLFKKIFNMISFKTKNRVINLNYECDFTLLESILTEHFGDKMTDVVQPDVQIGSDCLVITNGKDGKGINPVTLLWKISEAYTQKTLSQPIQINVETLHPDIIDADDFCKDYNREPKDAECITEGDSVTIINEVIGVKIDNKQAKEIIEKNKNNDKPYTIPAVITYPSVTAKELENEFSNCLLGTYTTDYSTSAPGRKENIRLASEKINGYILNPGERFSFNTVVGPRTAANGYKIAHVFVGNKTVDGIGGGICQVSSTLYNSIVRADLEIVYRTNHSIPVSYVPLGTDATVSYGTIDFIFRNNKDKPIKIESIADGNKLTINIYGSKEYLKDISIESNVVGTIPFSVTEIKDDTMYEGERRTEEKGSNGTVTEAYKVVKENGKVVSRTFLAKSRYSPVNQVDRVGTKKREEPKSDPALIPSDEQNQLQQVITPPAEAEENPSTEPVIAPITPGGDTSSDTQPPVSDSSAQ